MNIIFANYLCKIFIIYCLSYNFFQKKYFNIFRRIASTINAVICTSISLYTINHYMNDIFEINWYGIDLFVDTLYFFAAYLFTDGVFSLLDNKIIDVQSIIHHFVGGFGIYLMAEQRKGLGLGLYFAWTEISTPLLNLSWYFYTNNIKTITSSLVFGLFYSIFFISRIATIPMVLKYININMDMINDLNWTNYLMVHGGSYTLISLNIIWFGILSHKMFKYLL